MEGSVKDDRAGDTLFGHKSYPLYYIHAFASFQGGATPKKLVIIVNMEEMGCTSVHYPKGGQPDGLGSPKTDNQKWQSRGRFPSAKLSAYLFTSLQFAIADDFDVDTRSRKSKCPIGP